MACHDALLAPLARGANRFNAQFTVSQPNRVWASDITYLWTLEGWMYLAVLLDLYLRAVIGRTMGSRLTGI